MVTFLEDYYVAEKMRVSVVGRVSLDVDDPDMQYARLARGLFDGHLWLDFVDGDWWCWNFSYPSSPAAASEVYCTSSSSEETNL